MWCFSRLEDDSPSKVTRGPTPSLHSSQQSQITEDFRALRKTAEDMNLFKSDHLFFLLLLAHIIVMESIAWFIIFYFGNGWISTVITAFVLATSQVRCHVLTGHLKPPSPPPPQYLGRTGARDMGKPAL